MKHDSQGYWLAEAGPPEALPAATARSTAMCSWSAAATPGSGQRGSSPSSSPRRGWSCSRPGAAVTDPAAQRGFANEIWFGPPLLRDRYGATDALAIAGPPRTRSRPSGVSAPSRRWTPGTPGLGYLLLSAAPAQDGVWSEAVALCHELGEPEAARELSAEEVAKRCRSPRFRGGAFFPRRDRTARSAGVWPARPGCGSPQRQCLRGVTLAPAQGRSWGCVAETPGHCSGALVRAGAGGGQQRGRVALSQPAHGHLEPHGDHRAGPGRVGGGRLDRGRVHHRQQGDAPLPAHDPGRAHRLRLGRGPDCLRRPAGRPSPSSTAGSSTR